MNLQDLCERIVRDAIQATDSGATCFVPRYQIDQLREALSAPQPPAEAQRCTCPSGDGSLRWPCPAHPAEAQAQGGGEVVEPMTGDLLPCPFCGSENVDPRGWASTHSAGPACDDCGASAGSVSGTLQDNIVAWNRRTAKDTAPPSAPVGMECNCPGEGKADPSLHAPNCPVRLAQQPAAVDAHKVFHAVSAYVSPADRSHFRTALEQALAAQPGGSDNAR